MIAVLWPPFLLLLLVIVQVTILDLFSVGGITLELTIIVVIYAGFHLDVLRGGLVALLLGFFLDCLVSTTFGIYIFVYQVVFAFSLVASGRVYGEKRSLVVIFTACCVLLEGVLLLLYYHFFLDINLFGTIARIIVPQAIAVGLLGPFCFRLMHRLRIFIDAEDTRSPGRL
ncbi:MAG: hypothetical protein FWE89_02345 [Syntrophaceae bacterium]|nr:hypothetical protein [Syntrophaceae bacterium]